MKKKIVAGMLACVMLVSMFAGCGSSPESVDGDAAQILDSGEKVFDYGTTAYGVAMSNAGLNPHENYSGWSCVRYGVGETLFKFTENMELEPWLAEGYERLDEYTVKITLKEGIMFSSGRVLDGQAVKECLDHLVEVHDRAPGDLKVKEITADGMSITISSEEKVPALLNYLSDPYGAVIDMEYGVTEDRNVAGTGPFIATEISDTEVHLEKNPNYWGGEVKMDKVNVKMIGDGDTMTMALQSGEIDATQGLPYASLPIFQSNDDYKISSVETSRAFFVQMNGETEVLNDLNVRKAIAMSINKEGFTDSLLNGNGTAAVGAFPDNFTFGNKAVTAPSYNQEEAKQLLAKAGWTDSDGDGYVDKDGQKLTLRWLTYPGRQELPLLAEATQATLKEVGIDIQINCTDNSAEFLKNGNWDLYASAFVTAPTGDPEYFFTTHCLSSSAKNRGNYYNEELENLAKQLHEEFDSEKRSELAVKMQQIILDDCSFVFASHLKMSFVMKSNVTGFEAHPSDYYEITKDLDYIS